MDLVELTGKRAEIHQAMARYQAQHGHSAQYRYEQSKRYRQILRQGFPVEAFWSASSVDAAEDLVMDWLILQEQDGRPPGAVDQYKRVIKMLAATRRLRGFELHRTHHPPPKKIALTPEQIDHVLDGYTHADRATYLRDLAVFVFSVLGGHRAGEVARTSLQDLDPDRSLVFVQSSKLKLRYWVPVGPDLWPYLQAWLDVRPSPIDKPLALFTTIHGEPRALQAKGVYSVMRRITKVTGIRVNNNVTRHTREKREKQMDWPEWLRMYSQRRTSRRNMPIYEETEMEEVLEEVRLRGDPGLRGDPWRKRSRRDELPMSVRVDPVDDNGCCRLCQQRVVLGAPGGRGGAWRR